MSEIIARGLGKRLAQHRGEGAGTRIAETMEHRCDILPSRQPRQRVGEPGLIPPVDKAYPRLAREQSRQCTTAGAGDVRPLVECLGSARLVQKCRTYGSQTLVPRHRDAQGLSIEGPLIENERRDMTYEPGLVVVDRRGNNSNTSSRASGDMGITSQLSLEITQPGVEVTPSPSRDRPRRVLVIGGIAPFILSALRR
jgi:hypothetical protein